MGKGVFAYAPLPSGPLGGFAKGYPGLVRERGREEGRKGGRDVAHVLSLSRYDLAQGAVGPRGWLTSYPEAASTWMTLVCWGGHGMAWHGRACSQMAPWLWTWSDWGALGQPQPKRCRLGPVRGASQRWETKADA